MGCEVVISEVCCKVLSKARVPGMLLKVSVSLDYMAPLDPTFVLILAVTGLLTILSNNQDIARLFFTLLCTYGLLDGLKERGTTHNLFYIPCSFLLKALLVETICKEKYHANNALFKEVKSGKCDQYRFSPYNINASLYFRR